jgi:hypothetical protein
MTFSCCRTLLPQFLTILSVCLFASATWAAEFNDDQLQVVNNMININADELQKSADHGLDFALGILGRAFEQSDYARSAQGEETRKQLTENAAALKTRIHTLRTRITAAGATTRNPATAIILLTEEERVAFQIYRWFRTLVEMTDMANASVHREEPGVGAYFRKTMQNFEDMEDALTDCITRVAGKVLGGA